MKLTYTEVLECGCRVQTLYPSNVGQKVYHDIMCNKQPSRIIELYSPSGENIQHKPYPSQDNYKGYN